jgi:DNA-binding transcriptional ArsR family regulator
MRERPAEADIAAVAALFADPTRARFLAALGDGRALPAGELARRARVAPATASAHLAKLVDGGFLAVERQGRHRYFRFASPALATALEALAILAPPAPTRGLSDSMIAADLRAARCCYDHLAGRLGVAVTDALVSRGTLDAVAGGYVVTAAGECWFAAFGVDLGAVQRQHRRFAPHCLDWSERYHHLAGALGAALAARCFAQEWIARSASSRAVQVTAAGRAGFQEWLGIKVGE